MQVHRDGEVVMWYSRNGIEHGVKSNYRLLDPMIKACLRSSKCILDGELLVWNTTRYALDPCHHAQGPN